MTNLQRIADLTTKIRNLILAETEAATSVIPNDPLSEMWIGTDRITSGLTRAWTNERGVG